MSDEPPSSSTAAPEASSSSQAPFVTHQVSKKPLGIEQPIVLRHLCAQDSSSTEFCIFECSTWSVQACILAKCGDWHMLQVTKLDTLAGLAIRYGVSVYPYHFLMSSPPGWRSE